MPIDYAEEKYIKYIRILLKEYLSNFHVPYLELDELSFTFTASSLSLIVSLSLQIEIC